MTVSRKMKTKNRNNFNKAVNMTALVHDNTWSLQLKKIWDPQDTSYFIEEQKKFTANGLHAYWEAIDKTIRYADMILFKKQNKPKPKQTFKMNESDTEK